MEEVLIKDFQKGEEKLLNKINMLEEKKKEISISKEELSKKIERGRFQKKRISIKTKRRRV